MKRKTAHILLIALAATVVTACNWASQLIHNEDVVAEVGQYKLYRHTLEAAIPDGLSGDDSAAFASNFILGWTKDKIFLGKAESLLSAEEKDVTEELEQYRETLLKYRYSQLYISERLDTFVREEEIENYYNDNLDRFTLDHPIYRGIFYVVSSTSPDLDIIKKKLSSKEAEDIVEGDSLAREAAIRVMDYADRWADADILAIETQTDIKTLTGAAKKGLSTLDDQHSNIILMLVSDIVPSGAKAPLDYCTSNIKDIILSARKRALAETLEQDLLEEARSKNLVTVY